jgi:hypothetical protein
MNRRIGARAVEGEDRRLHVAAGVRVGARRTARRDVR